MDAYTAELEESADVVANIYSDNMFISITEIINDISFKGRDNDLEIEGVEDSSDGVNIPEDGFSFRRNKGVNSSDQKRGVRYNFYTYDNTFSEIGDELESFELFQASFFMLYISRIEYGSHSLDKSMKACIIAQKKLDKSKNIDDIKSFCEREINKKLKK